MKTVRIVIGAAVFCCVIVFAGADNQTFGQEAAGGPSVNGATRYRLVEGSWLVDDCTICGKPTVLVPITGGFRLITDQPDMYYENYRVEVLHAQGGTGDKYDVRLEGTYRIGGHLAILHEMTLRGSINGKGGYVFESGLVQPGEKWPWIEIEVQQVLPDPKENPLQVFSLNLVAVPWPQLWFSTEVGLTSGHSGIGRASDGDLLSSVGRTVRTNNQLVGRLGAMPIVTDLGLDGVTAAVSGCDGSGYAGCPGELWFSIGQDIFSETLGYLHEGDLVSDRGLVIRSYTDLIGPFGPMPPIADVGLDAVSVAPDGKLVFSVRKGFFSEKLGVMIADGDLLKEDGTIFKTGAELLSGFEPDDTVQVKDIGLDGAICWPNGEVWFSISRGFTDRRWGVGHVGHGDLLSSNGRVVMHNLDLLREFAPLEDLADFGLDALMVGSGIRSTDLDYDGDTDMDDAAILASWWRRFDCDECGGADWSVDSAVGIDDLAVFAEQWLSRCQARLSYKVGLCGGSTTASAGTDARFSIKVQDRYIYFEDHIIANCCAKAIELQMTLQDGRIILNEIEQPGAPCDCLCGYPISAVIGPLEPGGVEVVVYEHLEGGTSFVGTAEVLIEP